MRAIYDQVMGLLERLKELESMRQSGQISDSEYALLVASATKKFGDSPETTTPNLVQTANEITPTRGRAKNPLTNLKLIGVGVVAILIIAFLMFGRGASPSQTSISDDEALETITTETISNDVKFRKNRLKMHLDSFKQWKDNLRTWSSDISYDGGESLVQIQGPVKKLYAATELLMESVSGAYNSYPELAGEGRKMQQVLRELSDRYVVISQKTNIPDINSGLNRVEEMWPTFVEAAFEWEKALQKLIDESS